MASDATLRKLRRELREKRNGALALAMWGFLFGLAFLIGSIVGGFSNGPPNWLCGILAAAFLISGCSGTEKLMRYSRFIREVRDFGDSITVPGWTVLIAAEEQRRGRFWIARFFADNLIVGPILFLLGLVPLVQFIRWIVKLISHTH